MATVSSTPPPPAASPITLTATRRVIARSQDHFIGETLDYTNICNRTANGTVIGQCVGAMTLPLTNKLAHLASTEFLSIFAPSGIMRVGGSAQDSVYFLGEGEECPINISESRFATPPSKTGYQCSQDKANGIYARCFSTKRMKELCTFAKAADQKLVIGFNACLGRNEIDGPMDLKMLEPFLKFISTCDECKGTVALGKLLNIAHEREMPTVTLCHGPAALLSTCLEGTGKIECAYKDYKTMCFTDKTDAFTPKVGYIPGAMPWKCQSAIEEKGLTVLNTKETGATTVDRELISGDSPTAANNLGILAAPLMVAYATSMANQVVKVAAL
eukprot:gene18114-34648_t